MVGQTKRMAWKKGLVPILNRVRVNTHPHIVILGILSLTMLAVFCLVEFLVLQRSSIPAEYLPVLDLLAKLSLLASALALCIFVLEVCTNASGRSSPHMQPPPERVLQRPAFEGVLEATIRSDRGGAIVFLAPGPSLSEQVGKPLQDTLLKEAALRVVELLPGDACLALWGQTYIAIRLSSSDEATVRDLIDTVIARCAAPISVGVRTIEFCPQAGIALLHPGAFERSDQALHAARVALQCAEAVLEPSSVVYDVGLSSIATDRDMLIQKLPRAIYDHELDVFLQPRVELAGGTLCGFEALVRWTCDRRLVEARDIVSAAEAASLLVELDTFVLDEAIRLVADWNRRRKTVFPLSVNLGSVHFLKPSGTAFIRDTLQMHDFPAQLLTIELSETEFLAQKGELAPALQLLRDLGVRLSIDDFGAGNSTLADLRALAADEVKIDGSMINDLEASQDGRAILRAILDMTDRLKIDAVIEGVERASQAEALTALGCARAQGYFYGRPRPALDWLADATYGASSEGQQCLI